MPDRSHASGRQSNAAVDIRLKVARVGDDGAQVDDLVKRFDIVVADNSNGGDGASSNVLILVLAQLVLKPILEASASKMANADERSF